MLIGRNEEQRKLLKAHNSEYSQFITVYGRRRVGKTFFIRETFKYKFTFEHSGLANTGIRGQLENWQSSMKYHGCPVSRPKTWIEAFDQLKNLIISSREKRKVIFIDEMPWMDTPRSGFIGALEGFWNGWASARKDITLIVCGSATSWIINKLIKNKAGLRGRVTTKIQILPFTLEECEKYASSAKLGMQRNQIVECAMIMGGIPYYWSFLDKGKSLAQNIDDIFFNENGELHGEYDELFSSLFKRPEPYVKIIELLGSKKTGMTREEIIGCGITDNGKLTDILNDLEQCGFIRKYAAYGYQANHARFQLLDPYTLFYLQFIKGNLKKDERFWSHNIGKPIYNNWCGLAFERICLLHVNQIKQALGIAGVVSGVCSWMVEKSEQRPGAQIDLILDRDDNIINLCEMKYTRERFAITADYKDKVLNKRARFLEVADKNKGVHMILVSAQGAVRNSYLDEFQKVVTIDALFAPYMTI